MGVRIRDRFGLTILERVRLKRAADTMMAIRPLSNVVITVLPNRFNYDGRYAETYLDMDAPRVVFFPPAFRPVKRPQRRQFMPAFKSTSVLQYVMAHEWGHMSQPDQRTLRFAYWTVIRNRILDWFASDYGTQDHNEAYAEAFAEWHLTLGKTGNLFAQTYAKRFRWEI